MQHSPTFLRSTNLTAMSQGRTQLVNYHGDDAPLFEGHFTWLQLREGLTLQCHDCVELQSVITECCLEPHLVLVVLLEGGSDVSYGDQRVDFRTLKRPTSQAKGLAVAGNEPMVFRGYASPGRRVRRAVINIGEQWFDAAGLDGRVVEDLLQLAPTPMATRPWVPSARLQAVIAQLLSPPDYTPALQRIYIESRVLDVAVEALASVSEARDCAGLRPHEHRRIQHVLALLDSGEADDWSLDQIARNEGTNMCSLQTQFRKVMGMTVFEYQRSRRLGLARRALERDGVSVNHAAGLAGYSSAANFATAFKRQFGMTPRQAVGRT